MPVISGNVGAVFNGGTLTGQVRIHRPNGNTSAILLYNDTWDTDPNDPVASFTSFDDGTFAISGGGDGGNSNQIYFGAEGTGFIRLDTPTIGFFHHAAAAQPALTSGSATPAQIAVALQSLGLASGT